MKFVADESVDAGIVRALRLAGHEVLSIAEMATRLPDSGVLALAIDHQVPLITADKDFGELVFKTAHGACRGSSGPPIWPAGNSQSSTGHLANPEAWIGVARFIFCIDSRCPAHPSQTSVLNEI